jgi:hypothetical protein
MKRKKGGENIRGKDFRGGGARNFPLKKHSTGRKRGAGGRDVGGGGDLA